MKIYHLKFYKISFKKPLKFQFRHHSLTSIGLTMKSIFVLFFILLLSLVNSQNSSNFSDNFGVKNLPLKLHKTPFDTEKFIFNGSKAEDGQFSYFVKIIIDDDSMCGGSIIEKNYILTVSIKK